MSWTAPTTRATGNLITQSIWNTDLVDNLAYLKNAPTFDGLVTVSGGFVVNGTSSPAAGSGVEIVGGASPAVQAFNRTGGAYLALILDALNHKWKTSNTERWGINAAGDFTFGASSHIADSNGTPAVTSTLGGGAAATLVGTDYAFILTTNAATGIVVTFGHTFASAPVVVCGPGATSLFGSTPVVTAVSTTTVTISPQTGGGSLTATVNVLVRGY